MQAELGSSYVAAASTVVAALARQGDVHAVEAVLAELKARNAVPNRLIYHGLMTAHIRARDLPAAKVCDTTPQ